MNQSTDNRTLLRTLGVRTPIVQAPMGWIARSQLASAVSNAGAMGIIETSSGLLDEIRVGETGARSGGFFDQHFRAEFNTAATQAGRHRHPGFANFDLLGNSD